DPLLAESWRAFARHAKAVEMEAAGAQCACSLQSIPLLVVRGVSDVFCFSRDRSWNEFASKAAAAAFYGFLRTSRVARKTAGNESHGLGQQASEGEDYSSSADVVGEGSTREATLTTSYVLTFSVGDNDGDAKALQLYQKGEYECAIERCRTVLESGALEVEKRIKVLVLLAESLASHGDRDEAERIFLVASDLIPSSDPRHWGAKPWTEAEARKQRSMLPRPEWTLSTFPS